MDINRILLWFVFIASGLMCVLDVQRYRTKPEDYIWVQIVMFVCVFVFSGVQLLFTAIYGIHPAPVIGPVWPNYNWG